MIARPGQRVIAGALALLILVGGACPAYADERAAALFKQAQIAFEKKAFAAAAAAFEEAAQLTPHAATWLNAGEARERDGDFARAVADYDRALEPESAATETHVREAKARILRLESKISTLDLVAPSATLVKIDGRIEISAPRVVRLTPGHHTLDAATQPPRSISVDLIAGEKKRIELASTTTAAATPTEPTPKPVEAPPPPPPPSDTKRGVPTLTWIAFGTGAAAAVVGGIFGALTLSAKSTFTETPTLEHRDTFYTDRTITNVAFAVAGVCAITGVILWVVAPRLSSASSASSAAAVRF